MAQDLTAAQKHASFMQARATRIEQQKAALAEPAETTATGGSVILETRKTTQPEKLNRELGHELLLLLTGRTQKDVVRQISEVAGRPLKLSELHNIASGSKQTSGAIAEAIKEVLNIHREAKQDETPIPAQPRNVGTKAYQGDAHTRGITGLTYF